MSLYQQVIQTKGKIRQSSLETVEWNPQVSYSKATDKLYKKKWDEEAIELLQNHLKSRHNLNYLSSISRAKQVSEWHMTVGERCCFEQTTPIPKTSPMNLEPTSDKSPPLLPVVSPDTVPVSGSNPKGWYDKTMASLMGKSSGTRFSHAKTLFLVPKQSFLPGNIVF